MEPKIADSVVALDAERGGDEPESDTLVPHTGADDDDDVDDAAAGVVNTAPVLPSAADCKAVGDGDGDVPPSGTTAVTIVPPAQQYHIPKLSLWQIFRLFLSYGFRAFGGPVAQIALIKDELVLADKWISVEKFNRVMAVYQILPGPEATELCCYFGKLAGGYIGGIVGGLGFVTPGFVMMVRLLVF